MRLDHDYFDTTDSLSSRLVFVLDAIKAWRVGINPISLGLALAFGSYLL